MILILLNINDINIIHVYIYSVYIIYSYINIKDLTTFHKISSSYSHDIKVYLQYHILEKPTLYPCKEINACLFKIYFQHFKRLHPNWRLNMHCMILSSMLDFIHTDILSKFQYPFARTWIIIKWCLGQIYPNTLCIKNIST